MRPANAVVWLLTSGSSDLGVIAEILSLHLEVAAQTVTEEERFVARRFFPSRSVMCAQ